MGDACNDDAILLAKWVLMAGARAASNNSQIWASAAGTAATGALSFVRVALAGNYSDAITLQAWWVRMREG